MTVSSLCPDDSGVNCEPACTYTSVQPSIQPRAHWTFDGDNWQDSEQTRYSLSPGGGLRQDRQTRLNGISGNSGSLYLDGSEKASANAKVNLSTKNGFTWSVWISLEQKWKSLIAPGNDRSSDDVVWPILSTYENEGDGCQGFQLQIRQKPGQRSPDLVFLQSVQGDGGCVTNEEVVLPLDQPSWAWRAGIWHHVAVTYSPSINGTFAGLYWDEGKPIVKPFPTTPDFVNEVLYIGAYGSEPGFRGYIDELALFDTRLDEPDIAEYALHSTTIDGPSGCRWRATEQRDDAVDAGVSTIETVQGGVQQLEATIHDEDWGGGLLAAWLGGANRLSRYSQIKLHAKIPDTYTFNGDLEFALHAGTDRCTWYVDATQPNAWDWYTIELDSPRYCVTDPRFNCAFALDEVEWASIGSPSEHPVSKVTQGALGYAIDQIQLVRRDPGQPPLEIGGKWGLNHWCWRTEAFQVVNSAKAWSFAADSTSVTTELSGDASSSPALVVDFGDDTVDLQDKTVLVDFHDVPTVPLDLTLQDRTGTWIQTTALSEINEDGKFTAGKATPVAEGVYRKCFEYPWSSFPDFEWGNVSYVKIQKNWNAGPPKADDSTRLSIVRLTVK